jgi:DNA polymerase III sliding clamp (beta) subunit (PCNA family)
MLQALKFVQGAVAKKDFVPALTHFRISRGHVRGFNGQLAISSPIDLDLDASPRAVQFVKAIDACTETISLSVAKNGKLVVKSGNFRAHIDCDDAGNFPDIHPTGRMIKLNESLMPALRQLEPFIAEDASRPWACGVLFDGPTAFATNNIVLMEYWLGYDFPGRVNVPGRAVKELLRVKANPTHIQLAEKDGMPSRLTFHFEDGRWLSTNLYEPQWPDTKDLLDRHLASGAAPVDASFWPALEQVAPFADELERVHFLGDHMSTSPASELEGTSVQAICPAAGIFNVKQVLALKGAFNVIGFDSYPAPVPFFGDNTRGIIVGLRNT